MENLEIIDVEEVAKWQPEFDQTSKDQINPELQTYRVSEIVSAATSLEHFKWFVVDGNQTESSAAMNFGTMVHSKVLEPHKFISEYCCAENFDLQEYPDTIEELKQYMATNGIELPKAKRKADFVDAIQKKTPTFQTRAQKLNALSEGKTIVSAYEWDKCHKIAEALNTKANLQNLLASAQGIEERFFATLKGRSDIQVSGCPDFYSTELIPGKLAIFDVKTTQSVRPKDFTRTIYNFHYHSKAAMYCDMLCHYFKGLEPVFYWLAVETKYPFSVGTFSPTPRALDFGRGEYRGLLMQIANAKDTGQYPGPAGDAQDIDLDQYQERECLEKYGETIPLPFAF